MKQRMWFFFSPVSTERDGVRCCFYKSVPVEIHNLALMLKYIVLRTRLWSAFLYTLQTVYKSFIGSPFFSSSSKWDTERHRGDISKTSYHKYPWKEFKVVFWKWWGPTKCSFSGVFQHESWLHQWIISFSAHRRHPVALLKCSKQAQTLQKITNLIACNAYSSSQVWVVSFLLRFSFLLLSPILTLQGIALL